MEKEERQGRYLPVSVPLAGSRRSNSGKKNTSHTSFNIASFRQRKKQKEDGFSVVLYRSSLTEGL